MSYADERRTKALESIARELKGIGQSLKRIEEKTIPPFRDRDPLAEAKAALFDGDVAAEEGRLICGATDLPCIGCTPGACDHRRTEGGGNG